MATSRTSVVNYEYDDLRAKIQDRLKGKSGWGDAYESSVGQTLIDIAADAADVLSYMLERRSQESFQTTARLRSSVTSKASELGYRSRRAVSSNGYVTIELVDTAGNPKPVAAGGEVVIPEGTQMEFENEFFYTEDEYILEEGATEIEMLVSQGTIETITFDPSTEETFINSGYILIPDYEYIDENSLTVVSNNIEYQDVEALTLANGVGIGSLSFAGSFNDPAVESAYYDVRYAQDGMRIQFGDNLFGLRPDSTITVSYVRTKGEEVRVLSLQNEFRFDFDTFTDGVNIVPQNEYEYVMRNNTQIIGGTAPESIEDIRVNAPLYISTNNRAVSLEGYGYWAKRSDVGGIIDARAFAESEIDTLMYNINNVYISYLTETGVDLSPTQKQDLIDFIKDRDVALAHIVVRPADEIKLGVEAIVKRNDALQVSVEDLYQIVKEFLQGYFERTDGSIGSEYQKSDLTRAFYDLQTRVNGVDYDVVDFVDLTISAYQEFDIPLAVDDSYIRLRHDGTGANVGDTFTLTIDSTDYTVTVESADLTGEFYLNMLQKMRDYLFAQTDLVPSVDTINDGTNVEYVLRVRSRDGLGSFTIDASSGTFGGDTILNYKTQVHPKVFNNQFDDILLRGNVKIIDASGTEVYRDDGNGYWIESSGGSTITLDAAATGSSGGQGIEIDDTMIDYVTANIVLPSGMATGTYYIKYTQDKYENFSANDGTAVTLIDPKADYNDVTETFSTIELIL